MSVMVAKLAYFAPDVARQSLVCLVSSGVGVHYDLLVGLSSLVLRSELSRKQ